MAEEEWRPVVGAEGFYEVSSEGRIRSLPRLEKYTTKLGTEIERRWKGKMLVSNTLPYRYAGLHTGNKKSSRCDAVHRIVAAAFIGPRPPGMDTCHRNGDKLDNRASNLYYGTRKENHQDAIAQGHIKRNEKNQNSQHTNAEVYEIRRRFKRFDNGRTNSGVLAKEYGICYKRIWAIGMRKVWTYLPEETPVEQ